MTRPGRSRAITEATVAASVMSTASRSSGRSSKEAGQAARQTSRPICPAAPNTSTLKDASLPGYREFAFPARPEQLVEIVDGPGEAVLQVGLRMPPENPLGLGDVGAALDRVVDG